MRALVVYESIFGNTRAIAEAIADGLRERCEVTIAEVGAAPASAAGFDLLVVGGPTHVWSMSRGFSRQGAREQAHQKGKAPVSTGIGVREWLGGLERRRGEAFAATFDTAIRTKGGFPVGSAARAAADPLEDRGYRLVVEPEHFFVTDVDGPLEAGEVERARAFGIRLAARRQEGAMIPRRPRRRRSERALEIVGSLFALVLVNLHALWRPFTAGVVTAAWADVVVAASLALAAAVVANLVALAIPARRLGHLVDAAAALATLGSTIVVYRVFPFDFAAIGLEWLALVARGVMIVTMIGSAIKAITGVVRGALGR